MRIWQTPSSGLTSFALGSLIHQYQVALNSFTGGGPIVIFNDSVMCAGPTRRAVRLTVDMRDAVALRWSCALSATSR